MKFKSMFGRKAAEPLRWSVVTPSPKGEAGLLWGDTWFATDLIEALQRQGQIAAVVHRGGAEAPARERDDVVLVLRGLRRVRPVRAASADSSTTWMMWIISHPELIEPDELAEYDAVFAASETWGDPAIITPLLQATNPQRFSPQAGVPDSGDEVLFVGSTRGSFRPIVKDAFEIDANITIYGVGWETFLAPDQIRADFLPNIDLPAAYASAGVVLNDHWPQMAADGFLSNRLFDAVATGARVISDPAQGLERVFGNSVRTYEGSEQLRELLAGERDEVFGNRATRLAAAAQVAHLHSFDERARVLIEHAEALRAPA
ncbi:MAG: hypothetical protein EXQ60_06755 [Candidatus Nanopelagicales bacterium]|nr:hypothetical protein [Candidatus Nanopelagicales bacterium]